MPQSAQFAVADGVSLFERSAGPADAKASVVIVHGFGEHSGRYERLADRLNAQGYAVLAYDQRGHGNSPGKRGYIERFDYLVHDLGVYLDHVRPRLQGKPWFIFAHSLGALVVARYLQQHTVEANGIIFSSPFLAIGDDVSPMLVKLAGLLSVVAPTLPAVDLDSTAISRDPAEVRRYQDDPLVYHGKILARTGAEMNASVAALDSGLGNITLPALIIHGDADRLAPIQGSRMLESKIASADKTFKVYAGGYHELFNDTNREEVIAFILQWLDSHLSR